MENRILWIYHPEKNTEQSFFSGVPMADIDEDTWKSFPEWVQWSIEASGFWDKTTKLNAKIKEANDAGS